MNSMSLTSDAAASITSTPSLSRRNSAHAGPTASFEQILKSFKDAASQSPAERAAAEVLKKHGITREQLAKLPVSEGAAINKEIEEAVKRAAGVTEMKPKGRHGIT